VAALAGKLAAAGDGRVGVAAARALGKVAARSRGAAASDEAADALLGALRDGRGCARTPRRPPRAASHARASRGCRGGAGPR
jgi:hypothetical protein